MSLKIWIFGKICFIASTKLRQILQLDNIPSGMIKIPKEATT